LLHEFSAGLVGFTGSDNPSEMGSVSERLALAEQKSKLELFAFFRQEFLAFCFGDGFARLNFADGQAEVLQVQIRIALA